MNNILVASHERSGTHLLIDLLRNNLEEYRKWYLTTGGIANRNSNLRRKFSILNRLQASPRVIKTHLPEHEFQELVKYNDLCRQILENSIRIYIYRDGRDVLTSMYRRQAVNSQPFNEFIRNRVFYKEAVESRVSYWAKHVRDWQLSKNTLVITFEDIITNPMSTLTNISNTFDLQLTSRIKDVRLSNIELSKVPRFGASNQLSDGISRSSIQFNGGIIGSHRTLFEDADLEFYYSEIDCDSNISQSKPSYVA